MARRGTAGKTVESLLQRVRALRARAQRDRSGCFWVEGVRGFVQACDAGLAVEAVVESPVLLKSDLAQMLARRLAARGTARCRVSPEQFRSISGTPRASGIGAIVRQRWTPLEQTGGIAGLCWIVIEHIRSPGNLGTILRTAEAAGAAGVLLVGPHCDPFDPAVVRASMGGLVSLPLVRTTPDALSRWATTRGVHLVGLAPDGDRLWTDLPPEGEIALVIGEERSGLSEQLRALCKTTARLPMPGRADSLNVGVAAGVMLYELIRREASRDETRIGTNHHQ
jgi:RNA methyltransferase, TrmH family